MNAISKEERGSFNHFLLREALSGLYSLVLHMKCDTPPTSPPKVMTVTTASISI